MREIKFRGKRIDSGEWVYGHLIGNDVIVGNIVEFNSEYFTTEFWYKVDSKTIGQYIGLKDGYGNKIFEGDIIRFRDNYNDDMPIKQGIVSFSNGSFCIDCGYSVHYRWVDYKCEVIGYIFETGNYWVEKDMIEEKKALRKNVLK